MCGRLEKEKQELERFHHMTEEERRQEQKLNPKLVTNKATKGKYKFLQKYYHRGAFFLVSKSTHADRQGVDISVTVCLCVFVCFICLFVWLWISPPMIKLAASNFARRFHRRPRQGISHFCDLRSTRNPKSDELASAWAIPTRM